MDSNKGGNELNTHNSEPSEINQTKNITSVKKSHKRRPRKNLSSAKKMVTEKIEYRAESGISGKESGGEIRDEGKGIDVDERREEEKNMGECGEKCEVKEERKEGGKENKGERREVENRDISENKGKINSENNNTDNNNTKNTNNIHNDDNTTATTNTNPSNIWTSIFNKENLPSFNLNSTSVVSDTARDNGIFSNFTWITNNNNSNNNNDNNNNIKNDNLNNNNRTNNNDNNNNNIKNDNFVSFFEKMKQEKAKEKPTFNENLFEKEGDLPSKESDGDSEDNSEESNALRKEEIQQLIAASGKTLEKIYNSYITNFYLFENQNKKFTARGSGFLCLERGFKGEIIVVFRTKSGQKLVEGKIDKKIFSYDLSAKFDDKIVTFSFIRIKDDKTFELGVAKIVFKDEAEVNKINEAMEKVREILG